MAPTYTMSAHLCKQIYTSWRQTRQTSPEPHRGGLPSPTTAAMTSAAYIRASSPEKRSMDSERSDSHASRPRRPSSSSWNSNEK